jgi:hypothetical protein
VLFGVQYLVFDFAQVQQRRTQRRGRSAVPVVRLRIRSWRALRVSRRVFDLSANMVLFLVFSSQLSVVSCQLSACFTEY